MPLNRLEFDTQLVLTHVNSEQVPKIKQHYTLWLPFMLISVQVITSTNHSNMESNYTVLLAVTPYCPNP